MEAAEFLRRSAHRCIMRRRRALAASRLKRRASAAVGRSVSASLNTAQPLASLLSWLVASGATLDGIYFAPSPLGGLGAFASRAFASGCTLAAIPRSCMLTSQVTCKPPSTLVIPVRAPPAANSAF